MMDDLFRYDRMVENALRNVVREALEVTAEHGLTGDHHFYLTFRTDWPGVEVSPALKQRYPREMTIVLQHRYWDLTVEPERFSVTLTFNEVPETLVVPFAAVAAFADPSVRFGLQFASTAVEEEDEESEEEGAESGEPEEAADDEAEPEAKPGENVVTLDRFRNKT
ncbi:hypothetical protein SAMN06265365_101137 [Tistlia consotensis]|uniref:Stringent starvation protein B n=1 Tax=Tistlia consotensis USBA 355 TaxID=560819 RepID=A0A1Y6B3Y4_9PROT|nr:ClpXP protease specificity-enhancing factor SspB [Tistlia consotensis]SME88769.1 hypothetical protein SAMN05428998_101137 [Tistlia consotensis USBA 355]SNR25303.1 hypothetical protein SAMN06265365_101137 [Tistlia consotensis]